MIKYDQKGVHIKDEFTSHLEREMRRLDTSYNPTVKSEESKKVQGGNVVVTGQ